MISTGRHSDALPFPLHVDELGSVSMEPPHMWALALQASVHYRHVGRPGTTVGICRTKVLRKSNTATLRRDL